MPIYLGFKVRTTHYNILLKLQREYKLSHHFVKVYKSYLISLCSYMCVSITVVSRLSLIKYSN
jgi:hypothetical protein